MCFSAIASFGAGAVLSGGGAYALSVVKNKRYLPLAAVPLFFGIQQLAEGGVWLGLNGHIGEPRLMVMTYFFLFFSQVFRVSRVPFIIRFSEDKGVRKKVLSVLLVIGILMSLYLAYMLMVNQPQAIIDNHHIVYKYGLVVSKSLLLLSVGVYMIVTVLPLFLSKHREMKILGVLLIVTAAIAQLFYTQAFISVRCFFAAIISAYIIHFIRKVSKT